MTDQDQIRACAELDNWTFIPSRDVNGVAQPEYWINDNDEIAPCYKDYPADYIHSRDAVIGVIEKQNSVVKSAIYKLLYELMPWEITASMYLEALLRATGKWREES